MKWCDIVCLAAGEGGEGVPDIVVPDTTVHTLSEVV